MTDEWSLGGAGLMQEGCATRYLEQRVRDQEWQQWGEETQQGCKAMGIEGIEER